MPVATGTGPRLKPVLPCGWQGQPSSGVSQGMHEQEAGTESVAESATRYSKGEQATQAMSQPLLQTLASQMYFYVIFS